MDTNHENPYEAPSQLVEAKSAATPPELASPLTRLGAIIVDAIIGSVISVPIMVLTGYFRRAMEQRVSLPEMALYSVLGFVIYMLLHGYLLATQGQSIGKMLLRVRIVNYSTGELLPLGKLVGQRLVPVWIVAMIPCFGGLLALIDVLFIFGREQRCIHDLIAGTKVVKALP